MQDAIGITRSCRWCNSDFYCTDNDWFCTSECSDKWDEYNEQESEEEL